MMHNINCHDFISVFNSINGLENRIRKYYPELFGSGDLEISLEKSIHKLYRQCDEILFSFEGLMKEKLQKQMELSISNVSQDIFIKSLGSNLKNIINQLKNNNERFIEVSTVVDSLERMSIEIADEYMKEMKNIRSHLKPEDLKFKY